MDAVPEGHDGPRRVRWPRDSQPKPGPLGYLLDWLAELGTIRHDGPLTWADLNAWAQITRTEPTPREARALLTLSAAYYEQLRTSREPTAPSPWQDDKMALAIYMKARRRVV